VELGRWSGLESFVGKAAGSEPDEPRCVFGRRPAHLPRTGSRGPAHRPSLLSIA